MNLHNHTTTVTPQEATCLHNVLCAVRVPLEDKVQQRQTLSEEEHELLRQANVLVKWLANVNEGLYQAWAALPEGSALKTAYADEVWGWSDRDLCGDDQPTETFERPEETK